MVAHQLRWSMVPSSHYLVTLAIPSQSYSSPVAEHLRQLRSFMDDSKPPPMSRHGTVTTSVPKELSAVPYVLVRRDGKKTPLATPYNGPFKVIQRRDKDYLLEIGSRQEWTSIDRLKPAHVDTQAPVPTGHVPRRGRPPLLDSSARPAGKIPSDSRPGVVHNAPTPSPLPPPLGSGRVPVPVTRFAPGS